MKYDSTILIVDDEPVGRETLEALLISQGYNLAFASSGAETLAKAAELGPDVILLDVMMPGMDGFEVCRRLRADPVLAEVPVIMVTALDDRDSRLQGIEAGADDFVSKPFNRTELRARVRTITRLNRYRRLLSERAKFEWVVEQASDGYLMVNDSDEVLYVNSQARLYLGLPADGSESFGSFMELARRQYRFEPQEATGQTGNLSHRPTSFYLIRPESPTARAFWLQVDVLDLPLGPDGDRIVRLRDVTAEIARRRDMRSFHSAICHKLATPLTIMLSSLSLLTNHGTEFSKDEVDKLIANTLKSTTRLHNEIQDILEYLNAPGVAESSERFDLSQLQSMVSEISSNLEIESVTVVCPEDLRGSRILLSRRAVELVLWEILENAKKFHPEGRPTVEVLVSRAGSNEVSFQVSDDGLTISPEHLGQIWTPYHQGEKHFTGQAAGMGLGLATVAALVWEVGGTCHAHNRKDRPGVVVKLVLPLEKDEQDF